MSVAPAAAPTTLGHALLDALAEHGARALFGIPGDFVVPLFREHRRWGRLPLFSLTHEPAVGFAADGAARIGGGLGVAIVTWGAGALNLVNPVANAWAEKTPLVVISGAPSAADRDHSLLIHHQVKSLDSQARVLAELTVDQAILDDPRTAPAAIARVLRSCREHSRPVYLELPRDLVTAPCEPVVALPPTPWSASDVAAAAQHAHARLAAARRPLLLADVEIRRFGLEAQVGALAERLGLPIVTTFSGRGLLAAHPRLAGSWHGAAGDPAIDALVRESDVILGLGVIHSDVNLGTTAGLAAAPLIDARDGLVQAGGRTWHAPLGPFLDALLALAADAPGAPVELAPAPRPAAAAPFIADDALVTSDDIAAAVNDLFARHGAMPVVSDVGDCLFAASHIAAAELLAPSYYATMGYAIPAALGVTAVTGRRALVLVGDGAFQMTGTELVIAGANGWDPIVIVFDNAGWEMVRCFDVEPTPAHDLPNVDFAAFARALGASGHLVSTRAELGRALELAHAERGRAHVLHVRLAPGTASEGLRRFAAALMGKK